MVRLAMSPKARLIFRWRLLLDLPLPQLLDLLALPELSLPRLLHSMLPLYLSRLLCRLPVPILPVVH